jgi:hypothetical protein
LQDKNLGEIEVSHSDLLNISESRKVPKEWMWHHIIHVHKLRWECATWKRYGETRHNLLSYLHVYDEIMGTVLSTLSLHSVGY